MINKSGLRLGNWVYNLGEYYQWQGYDYTLSDEFYTPIPLTPEILQNIGWIGNEYAVYHHINDETYLYRNTKTGEVGIAMQTTAEYDEEVEMSIVTPVQSVHQLQNLYYSLTGKELEINLTTN